MAPVPRVMLPPSVTTCSTGTGKATGVNQVHIRTQRLGCTHLPAPTLPAASTQRHLGHLDGLPCQQLGRRPPHGAAAAIVALRSLHLFVCEQRLPRQPLLRLGGGRRESKR